MPTDVGYRPGRPWDFDSVIRRFEPSRPSQLTTGQNIAETIRVVCGAVPQGPGDVNLSPNRMIAALFRPDLRSIRPETAANLSRTIGCAFRQSSYDAGMTSGVNR